MQAEEIRQIMRDVIKEDREKNSDFWIKAEEHFLAHEKFDHLPCIAENAEYMEDHRFVRSMRSNVSTTKGLVWKSTVGVSVLIVLAWIGNAAVHSLLDLVKK